MAKQQVSWQLEPEIIKKVKAIAKKRKAAVQLVANELLEIGLSLKLEKINK